MAVHHAKSGEVVDLKPLGNKLRSARTTAIATSLCLNRRSRLLATSDFFVF